MNFSDITHNYSEVIHEDTRGNLSIMFEDLQSEISLKQSFSCANSFRGMHIQLPPFEQTKFIKVISGRIIDCVYVLDATHPEFGKAFQKELNQTSGFIKIPNFCAHGFYAIEDTELMYICHGKYSEENEKSISPPANFNNSNFSNKDKNATSLLDMISMFQEIKWMKDDRN